MNQVDSSLLKSFEFDPLKQQLPHQLATLMEELNNFTALPSAEAGLQELQMLEQQENNFSINWGILSHINATHQTPEIRDFYNGMLGKLSQYHTQRGQNQALFKTMQLIYESELFNTLSIAQQRAIELALVDFKLSGIALSTEQQKRYAEITERLSQLSASYSDHLIDATKNYNKELEVAELIGIPDSTIKIMQANADRLGKTKPIATLDAPIYIAIQNFASNRELREELYKAYMTRASSFNDQTELDNGPVMVEILRLRKELAQLLDFKNYGDYSLTTKMAPSTEKVIEFLTKLGEQALPAAKKDFADLEEQAKIEELDQIQPWDVAYLTEKTKQRLLSLNQEELKGYFPLDKILSGLFNLIHKLFNVSIIAHPEHNPDSYTEFYEVKDAAGHTLGAFYMDLFARPDKRSGAWMSGFQPRLKMASGEVQKPIAFVVANFTPAAGNRPAILTHQEIITLFHEFGHALHHLLTQIEASGTSGIHGVEWDAVELPSQLMEFWTWEPESIIALSEHIDTGEPLPPTLLNAMVKAKVFQSGLQSLRQIEFALFDMLIHTLPDSPDELQINQIMLDLKKKYSFVPLPEYNRFQNAFTHIFSGGYAAGYYSYKWAEVLAADAFERFEEDGIFNEETGRLFKMEVLELGGSRPALDSFIAFRGREPSPAALARHSGFSQS